MRVFFGGVGSVVAFVVWGALLIGANYSLFCFLGRIDRYLRKGGSAGNKMVKHAYISDLCPGFSSTS